MLLQLDQETHREARLLHPLVKHHLSKKKKGGHRTLTKQDKQMKEANKTKSSLI